MIRFDHVSKRYAEGQSGLTDISFEMASGDMAFLTGHSGAGKSTLLKLVGLLERPTGGQVWVNNHNLNRLAASDVPYLRRQLGMVFQDHRLLCDRSVFDNVAIPLVVCGLGHVETKKRVQAALDKVGLLKKAKMMPLSLSAGEQQRVGIARAVVARPSIILADEPTGNLDPDLAAEIMQLFVQFNQVGVTLLIATHDLHLITQLQKPALTLKQGGLIHNGLNHG